MSAYAPDSIDQLLLIFSCVCHSHILVVCPDYSIGGYAIGNRREAFEEWFSLDFLKGRSNVVVVGTNGLGKQMIAQNLPNGAVSKGVRTEFIKTSEMLNELVQCDGSTNRRSVLKRYCKYPLLVWTKSATLPTTTDSPTCSTK